MPVNTSSGSTIFIGQKATAHADPLTDSQFVEIGFIANAGEFGRVYSLITFDDLSNRNTLKFKGQRNDGKMDLVLGRAPEDVGQAAMIVALDDDQDHNFKVVLNDASDTPGSHGTEFYFQAKVMTYTTNIGGPTLVVHAKGTVEIKSGSIQEIPAT